MNFLHIQPATSNRIKAFLAPLIVLMSVSATIPLAHAQDPTLKDVVREADAGNYEAATEALQKLAQTGNPQAIGLMGTLLSMGDWGLAENEQKGNALFLKAAALNDPMALFNEVLYLWSLEPDYEFDLDFPVIPDKFRDKIIKSAEGGNAYAQYFLAKALRKQKEYNKSYEWVKRAAGQNYMPAMIQKVIVEDVEHAQRKMPDPAPFLEFESVGNAVMYGVLAIYYSRPSRSPKMTLDIPRAQSYAHLANFFGYRLQRKHSYSYLHGRPAEEIQASNELAMEWLKTWTHDPKTYLGKASAWCFDQNTVSQNECIRTATAHHEACEYDYLGINFQNFINFPGYKACRLDLHEGG